MHTVAIATNLNRVMAEKVLQALNASWWSRHGVTFTLQQISDWRNCQICQISARRDMTFRDTELADMGGFCSGFIAGITVAGLES
jgi:hypothetical protein